MIKRASLIITTYNRKDILLKRSLPSALNQTLKRFEVIVVDDCSTDGTEEALRPYIVRDGVKYVRHDKNKGLAAARNTGAKHARFEYIVFLDDDDALTHDFLETTVPILFNDKTIDAVGGRRVEVYPEATITAELPNLNGLYISMDDGFLFRKDVFDKIQYDESLLTNEDADFGFQFKHADLTLKMLDKVLLYKYGHAPNSPDSFSSASERTIIGMRRYLKKNLRHYKDFGDGKELAYIYRMMGRIYALAGRRLRAIPYFVKAWLNSKDKGNFLHLAFSLFGKKAYTKFYNLETKEVRKARNKKVLHLIYIPFRGTGVKNGDEDWFRWRREIFRDYTLKSLVNQTNKQFCLWLSFRPEDEKNPTTLQIQNDIAKTGMSFVMTFDGLMYYDDRNTEQNKTLEERLVNSLAVLYNVFMEADWILLSRLDSDDLLHKEAIKEIQEKTLSGLQRKTAILMKNGYIYNKNTGELAYWKPETNPPFHTIVFPEEDFFSAKSYLDYFGDFKSHEDIPRNFKIQTLEDGRYCVGIHDQKHHISTSWSHPFKGEYIGGSLTGKKQAILKDFGIDD